MKVQIYRHIIEVESPDSEISFRVPAPKPIPGRKEELMDEMKKYDIHSPEFKELFREYQEESSYQDALVSYGFSGTVREALSEYPEIVKLIKI